MMMYKVKSLLLFVLLVLSSCESGVDKTPRLYQEHQEHINLPISIKEDATYKKYVDNSLKTGATPYAHYYGKNKTCNHYGCSQIKVITSSNSDVVVIIKRNNHVVRHAYIHRNDSYTFSMPDGTYQTFFYYGRGWNPNKKMKGGKIKGGFVADEYFGKDEPQTLRNNILEYQLILQRNGNFSTKPSNPEEAL